MKLNTEKPLSDKTWSMVEEVAKSEIQANGKMLFICKNLLQMNKEKTLKIENYFDEKENDKSIKKMFFNTDGTRKTLIAKDYGVFTNKNITAGATSVNALYSYGLSFWKFKRFCSSDGINTLFVKTPKSLAIKVFLVPSVLKNIFFIDLSFSFSSK